MVVEALLVLMFLLVFLLCLRLDHVYMFWQVGALKKEIAQLDTKMQEAERLLKVRLPFFLSPVSTFFPCLYFFFLFFFFLFFVATTQKLAPKGCASIPAESS